MKKLLSILSVAFFVISCQKEPAKTEASFKSAYIDTSVLLEKYEKFKDEDEKFKVKSEEMGRPLEAKVRAFQNEAASFQRNAQANGMAWAQQKGAELQKREEQLGIEQNALLQQLQKEGAELRDSIIKEVKDYIKDYGKKKGYDYIYGTGDAATVLYAKDNYDITEEILKELNENYKSSKGNTKTEEKTEDKKEEKK